jgi:hypothetical protein
VPEVAERLRLRVTTLYQPFWRHRLPWRRIGGKLLLRERDLARLVDGDDEQQAA